jgi:hypothetical protein
VFGFLMLVVSLNATAAEKVKKRIPNKPIPTEAELGFRHMSRDEIRASIKRVGILPARLPAGLEDRSDAGKALQEAVAKFLAQAGFEVVSPDTYQASYDRFNRELGGKFDSKTGLLKPDVSRAVSEKARRDFIVTERLDAVVSLTVSPRPARFFMDNTLWDGVKERGNNNGEGTLPALSLLVQLVTKDDRLVFGRFGGIQLISYSIPAKGFLIARVPVNELLGDAARIERAARVATLPLVRSPKAILYGFNEPDINAEKINLDKLPPPPQAIKDIRESPLKVPRERILGSVKRVALSPLSGGEFNVPEDARKRFADLVRMELGPLDWEIIDLPAVRTDMIAKTLASGLYDPYTGARDEVKVDQIRKSVSKELGDGKSADAIIWLRVVRSSVLQRHAEVEWDGVRQTALMYGNIPPSGLFAPANEYAGVGSIAASSINVYMVDVSDTPLYESQGGLALLQALNITPPTPYASGKAEPTDLGPDASFLDSGRERAAVHAAFRDLTMTSEEIQAEYARLHPEPRKPVKGYEKKP